MSGRLNIGVAGCAGLSAADRAELLKDPGCCVCAVFDPARSAAEKCATDFESHGALVFQTFEELNSREDVDVLVIASSSHYVEDLCAALSPEST